VQITPCERGATGLYICAFQTGSRCTCERTSSSFLKCRSCKKGRSAPPVHMIKLTETREIAPYKWVHPDEEGR